MKTLIKRLLLPGYDLEKERAIQEAIVALRRLDAENKSMQAKIEQMERQAPVAWMCSDKALVQMGYKKFSDRCEGSWGIPVVALPGAKGEEK